MERDVFERSLKAFTRRQPFAPFVVELNSGSQLSIDHPEALVFRGGIAIHFNQDDIPTLFDHTAVSLMTGTANVASA